tara:strand:+ start:1346 stop:1879 length:534 start_codon:yes stop_codon:yes gene_type:complete
MIKALLVVTIFCSIFSCSKEKRIEEIYQECLYNSLSDKGEALKRFSQGFEKHLIKIKILKDSTPESYYNIYKSIANGKRYPSYYKYSYIDSINKIERYKINPSNKKCLEDITDLEEFKKSKLYKINKVALPISEKGSYDFSKMVASILPIMEEKDFELDYYKHKVYMFLYFSDILFY